PSTLNPATSSKYSPSRSPNRCLSPPSGSSSTSTSAPWPGGYASSAWTPSTTPTVTTLHSSSRPTKSNGSSSPATAASCTAKTCVPAGTSTPATPTSSSSKYSTATHPRLPPGPDASPATAP